MTEYNMVIFTSSACLCVYLEAKTPRFISREY
jgi:hypothetical protein